MDFLLDLEIVGSTINIFGEERDILAIIVHHKRGVEYKHRMRKEGFFKLLTVLRA